MPETKGKGEAGYIMEYKDQWRKCVFEEENCLALT